ncbi:MAG: fumarylacetoacetate hydrolase family protein [Acidaminobacteraceae bacterium]
MKFVNFMIADKKQIGILLDKEKICSVTNFFKNQANYNQAIIDMNWVIENWNNDYLKELDIYINLSDEIYNVNDVKILPPIEFPKRNVFCLGKNYLDHALEVKGLKGSEGELPKFPIYFSKLASPAIGDGDDIKAYSDLTDKLDYEVELAIIIGKDGINIVKEEAEDYIFGYTIVNDISVRNMQRKHGQWFKGKALDTHCPIGPHIVDKSEIPFPVELNIKSYINDELRQNSNTKMLIFDIPTIISDLSKGMTLRAGDIIITGTPAGVGLGFKPFKFLNVGDKVVCEIEKIGTLTNYIVD